MAKATMKVTERARATARVMARADRLAHSPQSAPPPEVPTSGAWAAQVVLSKVRPAQVIAAQAAPEATGWLVACENRVAKAAEMVAARLCRTEERGRARPPPPPPVHIAAPLGYSPSSYFFLLAVYEFQATKEEAPVVGDSVAGNTVAGDSVAGDLVVW
jgi:hypothetical protein